MSSAIEPVQLVAAVAKFLRERVLPTLDGELAFETRVSINALDLAARAIQQPADVLAERRERLSRLLGEGGSLAEVEARLCVSIQSGALDETSPGLLEHLRQTAIEDLQIDQPRYSAFRRALAARESPSS